MSINHVETIEIRAEHPGKSWEGGEIPEELMDGYRLSLATRRNLITARTYLRSLKADLKKILDGGLWKRQYNPDRKCVFEHDTFASFVTSPKPAGLEQSLDDIRNLIKDDIELLDLWDRAIQRGDGNPTGANQYTDDDFTSAPTAETGSENPRDRRTGPRFQVIVTASRCGGRHDGLPPPRCGSFGFHSVEWEPNLQTEPRDQNVPKPVQTYFARRGKV